MHFPRLLWRALWETQLVSVPELYRPCIEVIQKRGVVEQDFLVARVGEVAWACVLAAWGRSEAEAQAVVQLGLGAILTEFLTASVPLSDDGREAVAHLGTLANFLVGVYDDLTDEGTAGGADPLPTGPILLEGQKSAEDTSATGPPLAVLVREYFHQAAALPGAAARSDVARTLHRAVVKMHQAERATLDGADTAARMHGWKRKSALPFVVMGLPAWLSSPKCDSRAYRAHLRWLWRCGEFWGRVDDAVDLADDIQTGHPNWIWEALERGEAPEGLARQIAAAGQTVLTQWRRDTPNAAALPLAVQEAIPTCLFSALHETLTLSRKEVIT